MEEVAARVDEREEVLELEEELERFNTKIRALRSELLFRADEKEALEANGKTILENALITISTESGDGRHNDVKRELSGVFHAMTGASGRFKTGQIMDLKAEGLDVYNTILEGMGVAQKMGPGDRTHTGIDAIRA